MLEHDAATHLLQDLASSLKVSASQLPPGLRTRLHVCIDSQTQNPGWLVKDYMPARCLHADLCDIAWLQSPE